MVPTRRGFCVLCVSASLAGCSGVPETDRGDGEDGDVDGETPTETPTPTETETPADGPDATETEREPDEPADETPTEPELRERESELPELVRESIASSRERIGAAVDIYVTSADGDADSEPNVASVSLLAEPDRIDAHRELSAANDRLSGATSRADRQGIDDDPFRRLTELLGAEIGTLRSEISTHETLARGYRTAESVVDLADQRAYRLAESDHEALGDYRNETADTIEKAKTAAEPIAAATDTERAALEADGHLDLLDRLEDGSTTLGTYHDALESVPSAFSDVDDANGSLGNDDEEAFTLATLAAEDLAETESALVASDPPTSVESLKSSLLETVRAKLETAREIREAARENV
ncbi:hypothetical protein [Natronomonas sp. LN261]|jgi:hypothetical protein|uniref:hypothetical protein n=1 Tax=Natronomonas sp. LN261 TaxID=2750669 RepID=UPI0015EE4CC6|nr:hypothetical protein [Natronomonas sp. LN261]